MEFIWTIFFSRLEIHGLRPRLPTCMLLLGPNKEVLPLAPSTDQRSVVTTRQPKQPLMCSDRAEEEEKQRLCSRSEETGLSTDNVHKKSLKNYSKVDPKMR